MFLNLMTYLVILHIITRKFSDLKILKNLISFTGLDPAYPYFTSPPYLSKLSYNDANFVRVIHTSSETSGKQCYPV